MSRLSSEICRGMRDLESDLGGQTIVWNGGAYRCIPKSLASELSLTIGGLTPGADAAFLLRTSLFSVLPKALQTISSNGKVFQIVTVNESPDGSHIRLDVKDPNRKA